LHYLYCDELEISAIQNCNELHEFEECIEKLAPELKSRIMHQLIDKQSSSNQEKNTQYKSHKSKEMMWAVNNPVFHDVVFVVSDANNLQRFVAHKVILCSRSPYFKAMLIGGLKVR